MAEFIPCLGEIKRFGLVIWHAVFGAMRRCFKSSSEYTDCK